jgi:tungstate transport system ATP-binding protein
MSAEALGGLDVPAGPDAAGAPAVRGEGIRVAYRGHAVLDVPAIELPAGRTYTLLGASGAGKSTLLRVLGLLERPTAGHVLFDGAEVRANDLTARRRIAAVFQRPYLLRGSVSDNVGYGLRMRGVPGVERGNRIAAVLDRVGLKGWEERSALTLSGGEAQRVALARALVLEPRLLLLDEPLSHMDPLLKRRLTLEFADILSSEHVTALYVTHDQDEAAVVADVIGVMRDGRIVDEGDPDDVLGLPADEWVAAFVGMEPPLHGRVTASDDGLVEVDCAGVSIFAAGDAPLHAAVQLAVRPEDVTLYEAGAVLPLGSARNRVEGVVAEVRPLGGSVQVVVECGGVRFAASVSRASAADLHLAPGAGVLSSFKATAVRLRILDDGAAWGSMDDSESDGRRA